MANVKLGDRTYQNTAVIRMSTPNGTVADFYESNYYDIDISGLGNIVENNSTFTKYNLSNYITKSKFTSILEQRMIPRLMVFRDGGYTDRVVLNRVTSTVYTNNTVSWQADGDLGVLGEDEYTHFNLSVESNVVYLKCYRNERGVLVEEPEPYYMIDLIEGRNLIIDSKIKNTYEIDFLPVLEIEEAIKNNQQIKIKFKDSLGQENVCDFTQIHYRENVYELYGSYGGGKGYIRLSMDITEEVCTLFLVSSNLKDVVYSVNGKFADNFGNVEIPLGANPYVIDASNVLSVDFSLTSVQLQDLTELVNVEELQNAASDGRPIFFKFSNSDGSITQVTLNGQIEGTEASPYTLFTGITGNPFKNSYSQFELGIREVDGEIEVRLEYYPNPLGEVEERLTRIEQQLSELLKTLE